MKRCIIGINFIKLPLITYKVEIQKCGQNLCAHKHYFLMLGHICTMLTYTCMHLRRVLSHHSAYMLASSEDRCVSYVYIGLMCHLYSTSM